MLNASAVKSNQVKSFALHSEEDEEFNRYLGISGFCVYTLNPNGAGFLN